MAKMLVETLAGDFEPDEFEDDYREAVEALVKAKIEGGEVKAAAEAAPKTGGEVVDLLAALQRSVEAAKSARGEDPAEDVTEERPRAGRPRRRRPPRRRQEGSGQEDREEGCEEDRRQEDRQQGELTGGNSRFDTRGPVSNQAEPGHWRTQHT